MQKGAIYNFYKDLPGWAKGVSVLIVLGIGVVTYFSVRKWIKNRPPKVDYPNNGQGIPLGFNAIAYAQRAHDAMKGPSITSAQMLYKDVTLAEIANLQTDDMFVAVYDTFNKMYMNEGQGTFAQWVNDETFPLISKTKENLNKRFNKLNLK